jgi:hypothetical protein
MARLQQICLVLLNLLLKKCVNSQKQRFETKRKGKPKVYCERGLRTGNSKLCEIITICKEWLQAIKVALKNNISPNNEMPLK